MNDWSQEQEREEKSNTPDSLEYILKLTIKDAHKMLKDIYKYNYDEEYPNDEEEE